MLRRQWPWLVLASLLIPAVWHVVDFEEDIDPEFPGVERPTFSRLPAVGLPAGRARRHARPDRALHVRGGRGPGGRGPGRRPRSRILAGGTGHRPGGPLVQRDARPGRRRLVRAGLADDLRSPVRRCELRAELLAAAVAVAAVVGGVCLPRGDDALGEDWAASGARGSGRLWIAALVLADRPAVRDPGRRAGRLLAAVCDDRRRCWPSTWAS